MDFDTKEYGTRTCLKLPQRETVKNHAQPLAAEWLCTCRPRAGANFLMNCATHHRQYFVRNLRQVMHRRDVIDSSGQNLLFVVAMCFELTSRNDVATVKDFRHSE